VRNPFSPDPRARAVARPASKLSQPTVADSPATRVARFAIGAGLSALIGSGILAGVVGLWSFIVDVVTR